MRAGEFGAAELRVGRHQVGLHQLDDRGSLRVPELADVEVALDVVEALGADPAEHDVAGGLGQALALDDPLSVVGELALAQEAAPAPKPPPP